MAVFRKIAKNLPGGVLQLAVDRRMPPFAADFDPHPFLEVVQKDALDGGASRGEAEGADHVLLGELLGQPGQSLLDGVAEVGVLGAGPFRRSGCRRRWRSRTAPLASGGGFRLAEGFEAAEACFMGGAHHEKVGLIHLFQGASAPFILVIIHR